MTDVTDEQWLRDAFNDIADGAAVDPDADRPVAWHALRRQTRRRSQRRIGMASVAAAAVLVAIVAWPNGVRGPLLHTVKPSSQPKLTVVTTIDGAWIEQPIAYDGHDVWLVRTQGAVSGPPTVVERRDATSGRLLGSFKVNQTSVLSIAADGAGSVWLTTAGGDSGEPTFVTRIDAKTGRVVFTHTVTPYSCFCRIVTGAGATWLGGGSSDLVLRIDPRTGAVAAVIELPNASYSLAVVGNRVQVGLDGSRVAVIDPATNRIERVISLETPSRPPSGYVLSIQPVQVSAGTWSSWATRSDGYAFSIVGNDHVAGRTAVFLRPLGVASATILDHRLWAVGVDQLLFDGVDGNRERGFANYDRDRASFGPIIERTKRFVATPSPDPGLDVVVAAGSTLWIADQNRPRILVVQT